MQIRLAILSNVGGSGKTTVATHLAYLLGIEGFSGALLDLDPQGSVSLFCGLPRPGPENTVAAVLDESFKGNWPLIDLWPGSACKVRALQGEMGLLQSQNELVLHERGAYLMADRLQDYPMEVDVIIFDCPATLGPLPQIALSASTHLIVPTQVEPKSIDGSAKLLEWFYGTVRRLRLRPEPKILGFVPNQYDQRLAIHRNILDQLMPLLKQLNIDCFPAIRFSSEFKNASSKGLPLHLWRPHHPACQDFQPILEKIILEREG